MLESQREHMPEREAWETPQPLNAAISCSLYDSTRLGNIIRPAPASLQPPQDTAQAPPQRHRGTRGATSRPQFPASG